jgi:hypothetical protein
MSLNFDECETPEQAFWRKLPSERILNYSKGWLQMTEMNSGYNKLHV